MLLADQGLTVQVVAAPAVAQCSASASGIVQHVSTDSEIDAFFPPDGATQDVLTAVLNKAWGAPIPTWARRTPEEISFRSPAVLVPSNYQHGGLDIYQENDWPQVTTVLQANGAEILGITSVPEEVNTVVLNNEGSVKATFSADMNQTVSNSVASSWTTSQTKSTSSTTKWSFDQKFSYKVGFFESLKGESSIGFSSSVDDTLSNTESASQTTTDSYTLGAGEGVSVTLKPGAEETAILMASKGTLKVQVTYNVSLTGDMVWVYGLGSETVYVARNSMPALFSYSNLNQSIKFTNVLEIGFFTNASVTLKDGSGEIGSSGLPVILGASPLTPVNRILTHRHQ